MVTQNLLFTVAQAAKVLEVDRDLIKTWAYKFASYLSLAANPGKGLPRTFTREDIRVLAYVLLYWDEDPDIENIRYGLNSNSHFEIEMIDNLLIEITPLFIDPPDDMDDNWKQGVLFGGMATVGNTYQLANSYKLAGDRLMAIALENEEAQDLFCPAIYNYRHATELYLKAMIVDYKKHHDLLALFRQFKELLQQKSNASVPDWFEQVIHTFHHFDGDGTTFRYGDRPGQGSEVFVDFIHVKTLMGQMASICRNIRHHQGYPDA